MNSENLQTGDPCPNCGFALQGVVFTLYCPDCRRTYE